MTFASSVYKAPSFIQTLMAALLMSIASQIVFAADTNEVPLISVSAEGKVKALPDQVTVSLRFQDTQLEADDARKNVAKQVDRLLAKIERFSLKEGSLDTSQIRIHPQYNYRNNNRQFLGYQVDRTVEFTLSDLDQLSDVINVTTQSKASNLNHLQFGIAKPAELRNKALNRAIGNAKKTAQKIANSFDVSLGKIHSVNYQSFANEAPLQRHSIQQQRAQFALAESASDTNNFQQQALEFHANIQVSFTFK